MARFVPLLIMRTEAGKALLKPKGKMMSSAANAPQSPRLVPSFVCHLDGSARFSLQQTSLVNGFFLARTRTTALQSRAPKPLFRGS